jgi:hypothetical protein
MLGKDKLIYDSTTPADGDSIAAFLRTGSGALTSTGASGALDVNITNALAVAVDLNGDYDGATNLTPDSVGAIFHDRVASPAVADQNKRTTGAAASSDAVVAANAHGMDANAFGMIFNGTTWDRMRGTSGALNVVFSEPVADDAADSGNPLKVGTRAVDGALAAVSATGDRANMISDLYRRLWVNNTPNIAGSNAAIFIDTTAGGTALFAAVLAGRRKAEVQNLGSKAIAIGFGTVTFANGIRIAAGASYTMDIGPDLALKAIAESGTQNVRVLQLA